MKISADPTSDRSLLSPANSLPITPQSKRARHFPLFSPCLNFRLDPSSESENSEASSAPRLFQDFEKGIWSWFCEEDTSPEAVLQSVPSVDLFPSPSLNGSLGASPREVERIEANRLSYHVPPPPRHATMKGILLYNQIQRVCFPELSAAIRAVTKPSSSSFGVRCVTACCFYFYPALLRAAPS